MLLLVLCCVLALPALVLRRILSIPREFPRNIPVIPLYALVYDNIRGASRGELYDKRIRGPIEKHGAVIVWHKGRWTILTTKPEYLKQIFRNQSSVFQRYGLYRKVPWGFEARLFGENIIDADGELYQKFRKLLKPSIQRNFDIASIQNRSRELAAQIWSVHQLDQHSSVGTDVSPQIWRWAISVFGESFLDLSIEKLAPQLGHDLEFSTTSVQKIVLAQNSSLIGRIKDLFPIFDRLPWKFPITRQTFRLFDRLELLLMSAIEHQTNAFCPSPGSENKLVYILKNAHLAGQISEFHYRSNIKQLFIAGYENADAALKSILVELSRNKPIQDRLYTEIMTNVPVDYTAGDLQRLPLLNAIIYEGLRLYPPLGTLTNRRATSTTCVGDDLFIPADAWVGWHSYGLHTDPQAWGSSAHKFDPSRWGGTYAEVSHTLQSQQAAGRYMPFGMPQRKCLGETFALTELRIGLCELVRYLEWSPPLGGSVSLSKAILFSPATCTLIFHKRSQDEIL